MTELTCPECRREFARPAVEIETVDEAVGKYATDFGGKVTSVIPAPGVKRMTFPCGHKMLAVSQ